MYHKDSPQTIQSMFNSIAKRYDFANAVLSFSLHKRWNRTLVQQILSHTSSHHVLLDLCSGTGDIAFDYLDLQDTPCLAYLIDFSSEMLEFAKQKAGQFSFAQPHHLSFIEADVQKLPFSDQFADCATMAYGIRNVQDPGLCMQEVFRVLKPGGCFGILELTRPNSQLMRLGHQLYLRTLMPLLGKWLTKNRQAYRYLCQSIHTFIAPQKLEILLKMKGFVDTQIYSLAGGIATILIGHKPKEQL
jgi:demethylmenaquinone methyltransferase / 2-methoxy-6-polyprenyl-1,4-benzoquinol methylase